ncbi:hypothetical protein [Thermococcus celer]|uniref:Uncharacterized protein n=1 Tax=Thermococcus celer Vu 13 = JCM 8558 TaxID=1293037 RepID=A0A218NZK4_THECE|nr:hypothetical protein [Thermococcus celer]ASI98120.1 hypothetical protein A3L02_00320 [Thermococcus celer Vu 13 = JCM 8558]
MKVFIYNVDGLTVPVEVEPGLPFKFVCSEEECGREVVVEGIVRPASEEEFTRILEDTVAENPDFEKIREITARTLIFEGKVNGKEVKLPAESFNDFAKRFLDGVLVLR